METIVETILQNTLLVCVPVLLIWDIVVTIKKIKLMEEIKRSQAKLKLLMHLKDMLDKDNLY